MFKYFYSGIKYYVFTANFLVCLLGIALVVLGSWWQYENKTFIDITTDKAITIPIILIIVGLFTFLSFFLGCWGAIRENAYVLWAFIVVLIIVIGAQLLAGILSFIYREELDEVIERNVFAKIVLYYPSKQYEEMDNLQNTFNCCGGYGMDDWFLEKVARNINGTHSIPGYLSAKLFMKQIEDEELLNAINKSLILKWYAEAKNMSANNAYIKLPWSCCVKKITCSTTTENRRTTGCLIKIKEFVHDHLFYIGIVGLCFGVFELSGIAFSCFLAMTIQDEEMHAKATAKEPEEETEDHSKFKTTDETKSTSSVSSSRSTSRKTTVSKTSSTSASISLKTTR